MKMYDLRGCKSEEEMMNWIIDKLEVRRMRGLPLFFPAFNCSHISDEEFKEYSTENSSKSDAPLGKRPEVGRTEVK